MSKFIIKSLPVHEADAASFGKAYHDFVKRCWTDHKPNYSEKTINFLLDCAHIANGTNVKGLPQQGFKLTLAGNEDLVGDCLHLQYSKDDGRKGVDVWLNPHTQKALVDLYGFNPDDPYASTHKEFSVYNYTADDFCEFIESLPNYKGESMKKESKMKIKVREGKKNEAACPFCDGEEVDGNDGITYERDMDDINIYQEGKYVGCITVKCCPLCGNPLK